MLNFLPLNSRVHKLKTINHTYVKREDELSCTISGSKIRKYSSLIPYLVDNQYKQVLLCGSLNSNHLLGATQLLIENDIIPILFALKPNTKNLSANAGLLKCLIKDSSIHFVERNKWDIVEKLMKDYQTNSSLKTCLIPEGAFMKECLEGCFTLVEDIQRNESDHSLKFDNVFIDSGSSMSAIGLILGASFLKKNFHIHVILMADTFQVFNEKLLLMHKHFQIIFNTKIPLPNNFSLYYPDHAKSFGSVTKKNLNQIRDFAQNEGFFLDPIYNIKLFTKAKSIIEDNHLKGLNLIIHSGGTLSITGFLDKIVI